MFSFENEATLLYILTLGLPKLFEEILIICR